MKNSPNTKDARFTFAECRKKAEQKLTQAEGDARHRRRLITVAQGWLFRAIQLTQDEAAAKKRDR